MFNHRNNKGFTLLELMIVLVIAGIVLAASTPNLQKMHRSYQLRQAISSLETTFRRARAIAVSTKADTRVTIDSVAKTYRLEKDMDNDGIFEAMIVDGHWADNVLTAGIAFGAGSSVTFDDRGAPDNPGAILLDDGEGVRKLLVIAAGSGAVSVSTFNYDPMP